MEDKFECPECGYIGDCESWNIATVNNYGREIGEIQSDDKSGCYYVCPECRETIHGDTVKLIVAK